jgi:hemerythrin-like domain-containing protein
LVHRKDEITLMKITESLATEHMVFRRLFDQVEGLVPCVQTLGELKVLAHLVEALLRAHGEAEEEWVFVALDHCLENLDQREAFFQEHREIDGRLTGVQAARLLAPARRLFLEALAASRRHFDHEESWIFPLVERCLSEQSLTALGRSRMLPGQTTLSNQDLCVTNLTRRPPPEAPGDAFSRLHSPAPPR